MTRELYLADGRAVLVDDEDFEWASSHQWFGSGSSSGGKYATRIVLRNGTRASERLHRVIATPTGTMEVDHINGDPLDNRRCNLRVVTRGENERAKTRARSESKTGVRGVYWRADRGVYVALTWIGGRCVRLGSFRDIRDAERAYAEKRAELLAHLHPVSRPEVSAS